MAELPKDIDPLSALGFFMLTFFRKTDRFSHRNRWGGTVTSALVKIPGKTIPYQPVSLLLVATLCLSACATPIEVKTASKRQLELIDNLNVAVGDLESALISFHRNNKALIKNQGRVDIARQAIDVAMEGMETATADQLFETYKHHVQPWVDYAFLQPSIEKRVGALEAQIAATTDPLQKLVLKNQLEDLRPTERLLSRKPPAIAKLEGVYLSELKKESAAVKSLQDILDVLDAQIALMRSMQSRVDTWLSIDVAITQDQVDALSAAYSSALEGLREEAP